MDCMDGAILDNVWRDLRGCALDELVIGFATRDGGRRVAMKMDREESTKARSSRDRFCTATMCYPAN